MKRLPMLFAFALLFAGCAANNQSSGSLSSAATTASAGASSAINSAHLVSALASNALVASLTHAGFGLNSTQAVGAAGALLGLAQEKMGAADWQKIAESIPGTQDLVSAAKSLGNLDGKFESYSNVSSMLSKMSMSSDQIAKVVPAVGDYVGKSAGADAGSAFLAAVK